MLAWMILPSAAVWWSSRLILSLGSRSGHCLERWSVFGTMAAGGADPVLPVQSLQQCPAVGVRQVASVLDVPVFARGDDA